jgi:hypothetical protein
VSDPLESSPLRPGYFLFCLAAARAPINVTTWILVGQNRPNVVSDDAASLKRDGVFRVSSRTPRRRDAQGVIKTIRSPGGRRMFSLESINRLAGEQSGGKQA